MRSNLFALPFYVGLFILAAGVLCNYYRILKGVDKSKIFTSRLSVLFDSLKEIFTESLLHLRIFRVNPLLGYMHASIAFGWFLLIIVGFLRMSFYTKKPLHLPHEAVFMDYLVPDASGIPFSGAFIFLNDLLLLLILSGIFLALVKRIKSSLLGMKDVARLNFIDTAALISLWLIFPIRLFCESSAAFIHPASDYAFLSNRFGAFISSLLPISLISPYLWWSYSIVLGIFFALLPFSRYMHILAEPILILLRRAGVSNLTMAEVYSCPKCGVCIDKCQLTDVGIKDSQAVYLIEAMRGIKEGMMKENAFLCLLCARCREFCPVGIETRDLRINLRGNLVDRGDYPKNLDLMLEAVKKESNVASFPNADRGMWVDYLDEYPDDMYQRGRAGVIYFVGCIGSFSPAVQDIPQTMVRILERAGVDFTILADKEYCCGYPLIAAGMKEELERLKQHNRDLIKDIGADKIVFSCPSCYHNFTHQYSIDGVEFFHHTQFLLSLVKEGRLNLSRKLSMDAVYHDPCDLGRNSGVYDPPRELIKTLGVRIKETDSSRERSLCCGGGGDLEVVNADLVGKVAEKVVDELRRYGSECIITACQQCKRTLKTAAKNKIKVRDIAELVLEATEKGG